MQENHKRGLRGPLTGWQLIGILVAIGLIVAMIHGQQQVSDAGRQLDQVTCRQYAPAGWDCDRYPTGYPGEH